MSCFSFLLSSSHSRRRPSAPESKVSYDQDNLSICSGTTTLVSSSLADEKRVKVASLSSTFPMTASKPDKTSARLSSLREAMKLDACDFYIVPTDDSHGSEYTAPPDQRRAFISGFTGSAGTAIVSHHSAHLFTDGRYHVQAAEQLDDNWTLHKVGLSGVLDWKDWLIQQVSSFTPGSLVRVGIDPTLVSALEGKDIMHRLASSSPSPTKAELVFPSRNLVDVAWGDQRPPASDAEVKVHDLKYAGQPAEEKIKDIVQDLKSSFPPGSAWIVTALDEIAWVLNLRGASIPCNPVFPAYLVINQSKTWLFVSDQLLKPGSEAQRYVKDGLGIEVRPYDSVWDFLRSTEWTGDVEAARKHSSRSSQGGQEGGEGSSAEQHGQSLVTKEAKLVSNEKASYAVANAVGDENFESVYNCPLVMRKAVKNEAELAGFRSSHLRDGAAWVRWSAWLEEEVRKKGSKIDEWSAAMELRRLREETELYAGMDSYDPISASGPNAALPHYETPERGSRIIDTETPYLNDSGAQYLDGTIDCTRTVHFGKPTPEQKRAYTRVLQGHISIDMAKFPSGTTGGQIDCLARQHLWKDGYNYLHGTGHGVGSYLNVHEGPQGFSFSSGGSKVPVALKKGMVLSNEPGFYEEGQFGIRIESLVAVVSKKTHRGFGNVGWLGFERITQVPISRDLLDFRRMSQEEKDWLKKHNDEVREKILPLIRNDRRAVRWLKRQ